MRRLVFPVLALMLLGSGCATTSATSDDPGGYVSAARAHDVFADDFENAGRREQAKYHAERAQESRQKAIDKCLTCALIDGLIEALLE